MTELCHCLHNFNKKACIHKDFCKRIEALESVNKQTAYEIGELEARMIKLRETFKDALSKLCHKA